MLLGVLPESLAPVVALLWHGDIPGAEPRLGPGDREEATVMGMCQGHPLPGLFSPIRALSIEQRL